jgi:hypothetical protein
MAAKLATRNLIYILGDEVRNLSSRDIEAYINELGYSNRHATSWHRKPRQPRPNQLSHYY